MLGVDTILSMELAAATSLALDELSERQCRVCGDVKGAWEMRRNAGMRDGLASVCRPCHAARNTARRAEHTARNKSRDPYADVSSKRCPTCSRSLPRSEFQRNATTADGLKVQCRDCHAERQAEYHQTDAGRAAKRNGKSRRRATKAGIPSVPFDRTAYYGLPCYSCDAEADTHDHVYPLQGERTEFTWDAPWNCLPQCASCGASKGNRDPLTWWSREHRPFDGLVIVTDDAEWFNCEPDWAHVAAGL